MLEIYEDPLNKMLPANTGLSKEALESLKIKDSVLCCVCGNKPCNCHRIRDGDRDKITDRIKNSDNVLALFNSAKLCNCPRIHMSSGDAFDKLTILCLKLRFAEADKKAGKTWDNQPISTDAIKKELNELIEGLKLSVENIEFIIHVIQLAQSNTFIWQNESLLRKNSTGELGLREIGEASLRIRAFNADRIDAKNKISARFNDNTDVKIDHASSMIKET